MWLLILTAVNINNPADVPGKVTIEFPSQEACVRSLVTVDAWLKFRNFRVEAQCQKKS